MAAITASQIDDGLAGLDSGEAQGREHVFAGQLLGSEPASRFEEEKILVAGQNIPFSRYAPQTLRKTSQISPSEQ